MARYRIHRICGTAKENFRWAAHCGGTATVKPKDYEPEPEPAEAPTPYALWSGMKAAGQDLNAGDVLELLKEDGTTTELQILKYTGFEPAKWWISEPKPEQTDERPPLSIAQKLDSHSA